MLSDWPVHKCLDILISFGNLFCSLGTFCAGCLLHHCFSQQSVPALPFLAMANWVVSPHDNHFLLYLKGSWYLHRFSTGSKSTPSWMILFWSFSEYLYLWSVKPTANTFKWLLSQILLLEPAQHCETWWISVAGTRREMKFGKVLSLPSISIKT